MEKDNAEIINDNPILHLLEKHEAFSLIDDPASSLYPQIWGLCDFERKGIGYIGEYDSPDKPINIKFQIYQTPKYEDVLTCEAKAALKYWTHWPEQFPVDFVKAMVQNSSDGTIYPYKEITLFQQLTFTDKGIEKMTFLSSYVFQGYQIIPIYKINQQPTVIGSPKVK